MFKKAQQAGFTLVELSISLVIIGILAGGAMTSMNVIKNAKLKLIIKEANETQVAYNQFKEKLRYMPGDFPSGGKYWGNDCAGSSSGTDYCSGQGNYKIEDGANDSLTTTSETFLVWKHLQKAGLISTVYTGLKGAGSNCSGSDLCATVGANIPKSKYADNIGLMLLSGTDQTALFFGKQGSNSRNDGSFLTPNDAKHIDTKADDGNPITGTFRASFITGVTLTNAATCLDTATTYNLDNTNADCGAVFIFDCKK